MLRLFQRALDPVQRRSHTVLLLDPRRVLVLALRVSLQGLVLILHQFRPELIALGLMACSYCPASLSFSLSCLFPSVRIALSLWMRSKEEVMRA